MDWSYVPYLAGAAVAAVFVYLRTLTPHLFRDVKWLFLLSKALRTYQKEMANKTTSADLLERRTDQHPDKEAITFVLPHSPVETIETRTYTWKDLDNQANKVANWAIKRGLKQGDCVALVMYNCPEFVFSWLGLNKAGLTVAFINTSLKKQGLDHCLKQSGSKAVLVSKGLVSVVAEVQSDFPAVDFFVWGQVKGWQSLEDELKDVPETRPPKDIRSKLTHDSIMAYIYTSGTTGLPKAAIIKHVRLVVAGNGFGVSTSCTPADRAYVSLPLYHASAALIGIGMMLCYGNSVVLREKFSASNFFRDISLTKCTIFLYIGEICRYLLHTPEGEFDKKHNIRLALGNGLRPEVWHDFKSRFAIPKINEFYSSTEGNVALILLEEREGAIGLVPNLVRKTYPIQLVKYDVEKDEVVRNAQGLCVRCGFNEVGQLVGIILNTANNQFAGYTDKSATQKKVIRDVFKKGDSYFVSGDLAKMDEDGYVFFVDRIGDTFRWKGENISTMEVQQIVSTHKNVQEVVVYGVLVPGTEGKAGMAALIPRVPESQLDFKDFYQFLKTELSAIAMPLFIRLAKQLDTTGTHKYQKTLLVAENFNIALVKDPLYFRDDKQGTFVPITQELYDKLQQGKLNL